MHSRPMGNEKDGAGGGDDDGDGEIPDPALYVAARLYLHKFTILNLSTMKGDVKEKT